LAPVALALVTSTHDALAPTASASIAPAPVTSTHDASAPLEATPDSIPEILLKYFPQLV
jgi:hypothetical protein